MYKKKSHWTVACPLIVHMKRNDRITLFFLLYFLFMTVILTHSDLILELNVKPHTSNNLMLHWMLHLALSFQQNCLSGKMTSVWLLPSNEVPQLIARSSCLSTSAGVLSHILVKLTEENYYRDFWKSCSTDQEI